VRTYYESQGKRVYRVGAYLPSESPPQETLIPASGVESA
jgi:hypothetical protein